MRWATGIAITFALTGCPSESTPTEFVLVITSDIEIGFEPTQIDRILLVAGAPNGEEEAWEAPLANAGAVPLPATFALWYGGGSLGPIEVDVRAQQGEDVLVQRLARTRFVFGSSLRLDLPLDASCLDADCSDTEETCVEGVCQGVEVPAENLPVWDGSPL